VAKDDTSDSSQEQLVLTSIARDRPGLVERLASVVAEHSGNWIDSSMARLGGEFAGILRISVPRASVAALEAALAGLAEEGIDVTIRRAEATPLPPAKRVRLELTGLDHTGIVLEVTRTLAGQGVSIDELQTEVFVGSMGGEPMFSAKADLVLPEGLDLDQLRGTLEQIAGDIMVDIELAEA
jgi:glycine cleavage system regulatory protein